MSRPPWDRYVTRLCLDVWSLEPVSLIKVIADIEALIATGYVTDGSIASVLRMAGVPHSDAERRAPAIRSAIGHDDGSPHAYPP